MTTPVRWSFEVEIKTEKQADSIVDALDEQERKRLLDALNKKMWIKEEKKESKETIEKTPELEYTNFKIDSTNRKEITSPNGVKVKENLEGDVREYLEGECKGQQLFTWDEIVDGKVIKEWSATREAKKAGKKLPASWTIYRDIIEKKYEWNYQKFIEGEKMIFAGWRNPVNKKFDFIGEEFDLRCADGSSFGGGRDEWDNDEWSRHYGFSVRCLKD